MTDIQSSNKSKDKLATEVTINLNHSAKKIQNQNLNF